MSQPIFPNVKVRLSGQDGNALSPPHRDAMGGDGMTPVVTPVRVCVQHSTDRDLTLGTEHRTRVQRAYFTVEGAPVVTLYGLRGYCVIRLVAVSWDMGMPLPSVNVTVRKVRKDGTLGERSFGARLVFESEIPDWLAPVIEEHTPEWAR